MLINLKGGTVSRSRQVRCHFSLMDGLIRSLVLNLSTVIFDAVSRWYVYEFAHEFAIQVLTLGQADHHFTNQGREKIRGEGHQQ